MDGAGEIPISATDDCLISVVICTRNRADLLSQAVDSTVTQGFPEQDYEILVVDNASTDHTPKVVADLKEGAPVRYILEPVVGLSRARNSGWRAARGKYVVFLDDDATALPGWLESIRSGFEQWSSSVGAIGGRVVPVWPKPRPSWLSDQIANALTIIDWGPKDKHLNDLSREWLAGTNIAIPRALLAEIGGAHPWLGRVGDNLLSNEETLMLKELQRRGYQVFYRPTMAINHFIAEARLQQPWFLRRFYWQGVSDAVVYLIENFPTSEDRARLAADRGSRLPEIHGWGGALDDPAMSRDAFTARCLSMIEVGFVAGILGATGH